MQTYELTMGILLFLLMLFVFTAKYYRKQYKEEHTKRIWAEEHAQIETNNAKEHMITIDQLMMQLDEMYALRKKEIQSINTVNAILPGVQIPKVSDYLKILPKDTLITLKIRFIFKEYDTYTKTYGLSRNGGPTFLMTEDEVDEYTL